ncbi:MAG TPA: vitamin B12-dependent ribonucleotide reductase [Candidatus Krumholzibacteria bacterium]|nr:vitamin B12-dependent ribonucleotide reductase [Candidatus Krumholzibacteria bacterium]
MADDLSLHSEKDATRTVAKDATTRKGVHVTRHFTRPGESVFDSVEWELRTATIADDKGEVLFEQTDVEVPASWSQLATNVVVSKYFRGSVGRPGRETSVRQLIGRIVDTLTAWGTKDGYFATNDDRDAFRDELTHLLLYQKLSFNSPVWFNMGVEETPQCSACFINSVDDSMGSIMDLAKTEGMLFKFGSGTGTNFSALRGSQETLHGGGVASGPVSFMKGFDAFAGVIKSGGKTRRAAKMVILDADHPDIEEFIECKVNEEKKAWALIDAGYDGSFRGEAYGSVFFQNSNNSVRVADDFMRAVLEDREWHTTARVDGRTVGTHRARDLMRKISESAWHCGDPGMQYDTTINDWHTCKGTDRIYASNPCSEYMFLNDTACNLASLNLLKFRADDLTFDVEAFRRAVDVTILGMEIIVDNASYPRDRIAENSYRFRPLGLGYANLGALLMSRGLAYDSDEGRDFAAAVTALMCGQAYRRSAEIAESTGPFAGYPENESSMLDVIAKHRAAVSTINRQRVPADLFEAAGQSWDEALDLGRENGYRNSQVTVLAPTGTIAFMMDCDTTGIEPDIALIKYKKLVGGGFLKIVNRTVPEALRRLGYSESQIEEVVAYVDDQETIEGAPHLLDDHLTVFDCAFKPQNGVRTIEPMGHVRMMGAVQPFLSGAISKTVNLPEEATVEDIENAYIESWKLGLKAVAVYRDGSKRTQPMNTSRSKTDDAVRKEARAAAEELVGPQRRRLPDERTAITHKFSIQGHEGYLTVGLFEDGTPGELFVRMAKEGSVISGLMDSFATAVSIMLQYGVPLEVLCQKFSNSRFEPSGFTRNQQIPMAKSITDYIFRWFGIKFLGHRPANADVVEDEVETAAGGSLPQLEKTETPAGQSNGRSVGAAAVADSPQGTTASDAPPCTECGSVMVPNGSCYRCANCGSTSGCS